MVGLYAISTLPLVQRYLVPYAHKSIEVLYGSISLAPAYESKVMEIAKELGMDEPIVMRKMNTNALRVFGYYNAVVVTHAFWDMLPLVDTTFLFISEGFFEDLSEQEQRFLIGHELIHAKDRHTRYLPIIMPLVFLVLLILFLCMYKKIGVMISTHIIESYRALLFLCIGIFSIWMLVVIPSLVHSQYRRYIEWQADSKSLAALNSHDEGIQLLERWMKEYNIPQVNPYGGWFASHPSCYERRVYCLAQKNLLIKGTL